MAECLILRTIQGESSGFSRSTIVSKGKRNHEPSHHSERKYLGLLHARIMRELLLTTMQIDAHQVENQEQNQENGFRSMAVMRIDAFGMHTLIQGFEAIVLSIPAPMPQLSHLLAI